MDENKKNQKPAEGGDENSQGDGSQSSKNENDDQQNDAAKEIKDLKDKLAEADKDKHSLTEEIKTLRQKKADEIFKDNKSDNDPDNKPDDKSPVDDAGKDDQKVDISKEVANVLAKRDQDRLKKNQTRALSLFWEKHKEFHPDNDSSGIKTEAIKSALNRLNTEGNIEIDDILDDLETARKLVPGIKDSPNDGKNQRNPYDSDNRNPSGGDALESETDDKVMSNVERKLAQEKGWSDEKYLKLRSNHPKMVADLLRYTP